LTNETYLFATFIYSLFLLYLIFFFFFSSRRRHTRFSRDWSSDVCSSDLYRKYGRLKAAQVANVITYRARSAVRDVAKALGYAPGQQDAWSKQIDRWTTQAANVDNDVPDEVIALANQLGDFPRHLGIHSGGMVLADRPVSEICPVEWARMAERSVLQWDKDDCAAVGLVKFDLLGLGMLSAIKYAVE